MQTIAKCSIGRSWGFLSFAGLLLHEHSEVDVLAADRLVRVDRHRVRAFAQGLAEGLGDDVHLVVADVVLNAQDLPAVDIDLGVFVVGDDHRAGL